jgi:hypothetical protein
LGSAREESMIGFMLCPDGCLRFVDRATSRADAMALLAFAKAVADLEITKIAAASLTPTAPTRIAA